jgi:hypothetical protein
VHQRIWELFRGVPSFYAEFLSLELSLGEMSRRERMQWRETKSRKRKKQGLQSQANRVIAPMGELDEFVPISSDTMASPNSSFAGPSALTANTSLRSNLAHDANSVVYDGDQSVPSLSPMRHTGLALIDEEIEQEELSAEEYLVEQLAQVPSMPLKQLPSIIDLARVLELDFPVGTPEPYSRRRACWRRFVNRSTTLRSVGGQDGRVGESSGEYDVDVMSNPPNKLRQLKDRLLCILLM